MSGSRWLEERHARWGTPPAVIARLVRDAAGDDLVTTERIIEGESNETYRVTTGGGRDLLVKIQRGRSGAFAHLAEHAAMCRSVGVDAPEVLLREALPDQDAVAVVQTFLTGTPLNQLVDVLPAEQVRALTTQAGELMARIHSVAVPAREPVSSVQCLDEMRADMPTAAPALERAGLSPDHITALGARHADLLDRWERCLVHGDFGADHLIVRDGRTYGVIDLDLATDGIPVADVSWWSTYFDRKPHPLAAILEGYRRVAPLEDADAAVLVHNLLTGIGKLAYFIREQHDGGDGFMLRRIAAWVEQIERL